MNKRKLTILSVYGTLLKNSYNIQHQNSLKHVARWLELIQMLAVKILSFYNVHYCHFEPN